VIRREIAIHNLADYLPHQLTRVDIVAVRSDINQGSDLRRHHPRRHGDPFELLPINRQQLFSPLLDTNSSLGGTPRARAKFRMRLVERPSWAREK